MSKLVESLRWLVKPQNLSPKEQKDRRKVVTTVVAGTAMLAVGGVAACAEIIKKNSNEATATEPTSDQGNGNGETATSALTEVIETKVPSGTLPPPEFKIGAGGAYTEAQKKIIESDLV
ncbi:MAG: hypothetical protein NTY75_04210, partial [Candidatus Shapirobacteria bacterium]|nr:hypothetical protein [Candidatus Shapirobacteria bacterium]